MKKSRDPSTAIGACVITVALSMAGTATVLATDNTSASAPTNRAIAPAQKSATTVPAATQLHAIVVTGIRADLEKALQLKKYAPVMLDAIESTTLGRFPSSDVANALAHVPGITITRTTGGDGQHISVDGLGPAYNMVTLDGQELATDNSGRELAFDVLPAEMVTGAEVLQSPQASTMAGAIGGTVNLQTATAFDYTGFHADVNVDGDWNDMSHLSGTKYSFFVADTNRKRTLGYVFGAVYSNANQRTDSLNAYNQNIYGPTTYPYAGGPGAVPLTATPCCITFGSIFDHRKRYGVVTNVEWRPTSTLRVQANALWTYLNDPQIGYNESYYFAANPDGTPWQNNAVVQNGVITSVSVNQFQPEMVNNTMNRKVNTYLYGLKVRWKPTKTLTLNTNVYRSAASRPEGGKDTFVTAGLVNNSPVAEDILNFTDLPNSLPSINVALPPSQLGLSSCPAGSASSTNPGYCSYTTLMNSGFLDNNKYWSTHYDGLNGYSVHDKITGFSLHGVWQANMGVFDQLEFGVNGRWRTKEQMDISNDWTNGSGQYGTLYQTAGCPVQCSPYSFGSQGFNVVSFTTPPNFMEGAGGSYPTTLPMLNVGQLLAFMQSLNGKPNPFYCTTTPCTGPYTPFNFALTLPQLNPANSYRVTERTVSGYLEGVFSGHLFSRAWFGNIGVHVLHTTTTASSESSVPVSLWTPSANASTVQTWNVQYSTSQPFGANGGYTIALPSLNLAYWVVSNELQARLALAQTMARPQLNELAPTSSNNAINGQPQIFYGGTANLKPIRANQANLSLEWYYARNSALTLAVFYKELRDDIYDAVLNNVNLGTTQYVGGTPGTVAGTPFLWSVTVPANGYKDTYAGVQVQWQALLRDGFGTNMQFTYTRSRSYDQSGQLIGAINSAPPKTFAVGFFYDKGRINADVNWDYQSSFTSACSQCTEVPGWPAITDSFNWVTASIHYRLAHGFEVYWEGRNLSNSIYHTYLNGNPLLPWAPGQNVGGTSSGVGHGYSAFGRTYVVGVSWRY